VTDTTNHAAPLEVVTRWFEKARDTCAKQGRHESALLWSDGLAHLIRMNAALDALTRELEDQERSHLKTIDQRDAAEDALGDAYALVTGNQPEWSNAFGYANALEDIDATIAAQSARIATLEEALGFYASLDGWDQGRHTGKAVYVVARAALAPKEAQG
jgi:hypothetical protein